MKESLPSIKINGEEYSHVQNRLIGGQVYANKDRSVFVRTNAPAEIAGEVNITRELYSRGFPVPQVLEQGTLETGEAYFSEESIGAETLGQIFTKETTEHGHASDESFDVLISVLKKYCEAQFRPENYVPHDKDALAHTTSLANVLRNNPPSEEMKEAFEQAYDKAAERTLTLPWGYVQADLGMFNILPRGVIDFELAGIGPVGYDVLTCLYFGHMWPSFKRKYWITERQITRGMEIVDALAEEHGLPKISSYTDDFLVLKLIWGSGKDIVSERNPNSDPEFWRWRVGIRDWTIKRYLQGEKIDVSRFEEIGNASI